jgi:membrane protein implicated in regulation of membrane protease activity
MTLGTGLTALFVGMFLLIIGMYSWASPVGTFTFFIGFALAIAGAATAFARARRRSR